MKKYNKVILVAVDTLSKDHLGCYGYKTPEENTSPFIDSLAEKNLKFENFYASDVPTPSSFTSFLTGTRGIHNGIVGFNNSIEEFSVDTPTLAERYFEEGFRTGMMSNLIYPCPWLKSGFQDIYPPGMSFQGGTAEEVTEESSNWLDNHAQEDFFLFTHYWDPHCPYRERSKEEYRKMFSREEYENYAPDMKYFKENEYLDLLYKEKHEENNDPYEPAENLRNYDSNIRYVDGCLENLFIKLKDLGIRDETLVLITSDHGEAFGEYGFWDHYSSYRNISNIPLIIVGDKINSKNVETYAQSVDLMPTLLELCGLDSPQGLDGKSMTPLLEGEDEFRGSVIVNSDATVIQRMYVKNDHALVHTPSRPVWDHIDEYELFDLSEDSRQIRNIADKEEEKAQKLRLELQDWLSKELDGSPDPLQLSIFRGGWMWNGFSRILEPSKWKNLLKEYPKLKNTLKSNLIYQK
ncbi:hypothetical protein AKJ65_06975 [candidate division MSBL1 archaeon SCGC-AAA259E19]|uniref:Sulfatase N-terminal domain-containing protein n=1 Tax=candidate division MSBL1 archaeon SCGC-AAA259E19 TaxID=1698264 RepID=A0A133UF40_9EURY|nr:hypothetical protein AKJ65_06975 [candidate division MSBL1 archaeon SCGC-AAA259E19]